MKLATVTFLNIGVPFVGSQNFEVRANFLTTRSLTMEEGVAVIKTSDISEVPSKSMWNRIKDSGEAISSRSTKASAEAFEKTGINQKFETISKTVSENKVTKNLVSAKNTFGGKLDEVTGSRLLELLEIRLEKQDYYNDVLATRLAEALNRIDALEKNMESIKNEN